MNTQRLMEIALEMAGLDEIPGDSAIHHPGDGIERVMIGIDAKAPELLLAKRLGVDAVISHHPVGGSSTLRFHEVLWRHLGQMASAGVPLEVAEPIVAELAETHRINASMANVDHDRSVARLLELPYLNIHTPLDEIGRRRMAEVAEGLPTDASVEDFVAALRSTLVEFRAAPTDIEVRVGRAENPLGWVVISHGAGTNGGYPIAKAYFDHGIDTVVYIHCRPGDSDRLSKEIAPNKNLVVTGHIASDAVGIAPYVDRLRREGLDVIPFSGIPPR